MVIHDSNPHSSYDRKANNEVEIDDNEFDDDVFHASDE